jgi:hypothetical protein
VHKYALLPAIDEKILPEFLKNLGASRLQLVEELRYKPEDRGFDK